MTLHHRRPARVGPALALLLGAGLLVGAPSGAAAQPSVQAATYQAITFDFNSGYNEYAAPGDYRITNGSVLLQTQPYTLLRAQAVSTSRTGSTISTSAAMQYSFMFVGAPATRVSALFLVDLFASMTSPSPDENSGVLSAFNLYSPDGVGRFYDGAGTPLAEGPSQVLRFSGALTERFNTPVPFIVDANTEYRVALYAAVAVGSTNTAEASVDPVIALAPASQGAYALVLSPGVSNAAPTVTATPEPGTWLLLGSGLLGVGVVARRRRA